MKSFKPILIVAGEPNSIFIEILIKSLKKKKFKSPIILIVSKKIFELQLKKLKIKFPFKIIKEKEISKKTLNNNKLNIINVRYNTKNAFEKISSKSNSYIDNCFKIALRLLKLNFTNKFINGPISKKFFLKNKYLGITEFLADKTKTKNYAMLIFNKNLSVCPITTHLPIKQVSKKISKKNNYRKNITYQ